MVQNATEGKKDVRRVNVGQGCSNRGLGIVAVTVINWGQLMKGGINYTRYNSYSRDKSSSETQRLLAGTMQYFRASDIFGPKFTLSADSPGNLFLPNQFQKWSNSVPLIGQKNINQR